MKDYAAVTECRQDAAAIRRGNLRENSSRGPDKLSKRDAVRDDVCLLGEEIAEEAKHVLCTCPAVCRRRLTRLGEMRDAAGYKVLQKNLPRFWERAGGHCRPS